MNVEAARTPRPLIAMSSRPRGAGDVRGWPDTIAAVMQGTYLESVWRAGGQDLAVAPRSMSDDDALALLSRVDGLVLVGGGDVDPARYGEEPHEAVYGVDAASDALETALARAAIHLGVPTLAICRGLQVVNVAMGGSLEQHLGDRDDLLAHGMTGSGPVLHRVEAEPGSLLAKTQGGTCVLDACWSAHHQAIGRLADGLVVSARSSDDVIEALELRAEHPFFLAVQWHPERTSAHDAAQQALFDALIDAARRRTPR